MTGWNMRVFIRNMVCLLTVCLLCCLLALATTAADNSKSGGSVNKKPANPDTPADEILTGSCGDSVSWTLNKTTKVLTISGTGAMTDYAQNTDIPWYSDRTSILTIKVESGITHVGSYAFSYSLNATSASLASSVTSIGSNAFLANYVLASVEMPGVQVLGHHAFSNCPELNHVEWPSALKEIGDHAFYSCKKLNNPVFSDNLTAIGEYAFAYCDAMTAVSLPVSLVNIGPYTFDSCKGLKTLTLANQKLVMYMFRGCSALELVVIPNGVQTLPKYIFADCTALRWIWIPDTVTSIGGSAFEACSGLRRITIPSSVRAIESGAFYHCLNLTTACYFGTEEEWNKVAVGNSNNPLTALALEYDARDFIDFRILTEGSCTHDASLQYLASDGTTRTERIPASGHQYENGVCTACGKMFAAGEELLGGGDCSASIQWTLSYDGTLTVSGTGEMPNYGVRTNAPWYDLRNSVQRVVVESGITFVGGETFTYLQSLTEVVLADTVTALGNSSFFNCNQLRSVSLPAHLLSIGDYAFFNCYSLPQITLPDTLTSIGEHAFDQCKVLSDLVLPESLVSTGQYAFANCDALTQIRLPASLRVIGDYLFYGCANLSDVALPDTMTSLSIYMFYGCKSLTQIVLPKALTSISPYAFSDCTSLVWLWIPDGVTSIGKSAFECCERMEQIVLPGSINNIGAGAFYHCFNFSSFCFFGTEETWNQVNIEAFNEPLLNADAEFNPHLFNDFSIIKPTCTVDGVVCYTAEDGAVQNERLQALGHKYEAGISSTQWVCACCGDTVTVPSGTRAFGACGPNLTWSLSSDGTLRISGTGPMISYGIRTSPPWYDYDLRKSILTAIVEPGVTTIGRDAFSYCINMTSARLADTVTQIGEEAFSACYALSDVKLSAGLREIGSHGFFGCNTLPSLSLPESLTSIGEYAFYNCKALGNLQYPAALQEIGQWAFAYCDEMTEALLPEHLQSLGDYAFDTCAKLQTVSLPESLRYLGIYAFRGCSKLAGINIPSALTKIGEDTFYGCASLTEIVLSESICQIEQCAFYNCSSLTKVVVYSEDCTFGRAVFSGCPNTLTIWGIADSDVEAYANANGITFQPLEVVTPDNPEEPAPDSDICKHVYDSEHTVVVTPTPETDGSVTQTCTICGHTETHVLVCDEIKAQLSDPGSDDNSERLTLEVCLYEKTGSDYENAVFCCVAYDDSGRMVGLDTVQREVKAFEQMNLTFNMECDASGINIKIMSLDEIYTPFMSAVSAVLDY